MNNRRKSVRLENENGKRVYRNDNYFTEFGSSDNRINKHKNQCPKGYVMNRGGNCEPAGKSNVGPVGMDCIALCEGYFHTDDGTCTSGLYSGITQCPCNCCNSYFITQETDSWFPWEGSSLDGAYTQCNCSACYSGYNQCINDCLNSDGMSADGDISGGTGRFQQGGRIKSTKVRRGNKRNNQNSFESISDGILIDMNTGNEWNPVTGNCPGVSCPCDGGWSAQCSCPPNGTINCPSCKCVMEVGRLVYKKGGNVGRGKIPRRRRR